MEALLGFTAIAVYALILVALALTPATIAFWRHHPHRWAILLVNVFLGATIVGWIMALIWALNSPRNHASALNRHLSEFTNLFSASEAGPDKEISGFRRAEPTLTSATPVRPDGNPRDVTIEIERLARLRTDGDLTDVEYEALKSRVIASA